MRTLWAIEGQQKQLLPVCGGGEIMPPSATYLCGSEEPLAKVGCVLWYICFPFVLAYHSVRIYVVPCLISYALGACGQFWLLVGEKVRTANAPSVLSASGVATAPAVLPSSVRVSIPGSARHAGPLIRVHAVAGAVLLQLRVYSQSLAVLLFRIR